MPFSYSIMPQTALYSLLGMPKPLKMGSWECGRGKEGGEERGESKGVQGRQTLRAWTVGRATSVSEAYVIMCNVRTWRRGPQSHYTARQSLGEVQAISTP